MEDAYLDGLMCSRFRVMLHDVDHTNEEGIMFALVIPKIEVPLENLIVL